MIFDSDENLVDTYKGIGLKKTQHNKPIILLLFKSAVAYIAKSKASRWFYLAFFRLLA